MLKIFAKFFLFLFLFVFLLLPKNSHAISISPLRQMLVVDFGKIEEIKINVTNDEQEKKIFVPEVDGFTIDPENGRPQFDQKDIAINWIKPKNNSLELNPGQSGEFVFKVSIPKEADPGGHYLGLFAREKGSGGQIALGSRVGSLLFLYSSGVVKEELNKVSFFSKNKFFFIPYNKIFLELKNVGNIHLVPVGEIKIFGYRGKIIQQINLNENLRKVLPNNFWIENYEINKISLFDAGQIKIVLLSKYGATNKELIDSFTIWYFPWQILSFIFLIFVVSFIILLKRLKKTK